MSVRTLNPAPSSVAVALAQLRMVALLQRRDFAILGLIALGLIGLALLAYADLPAEIESEIGKALREAPQILPLFPPLVFALVPLAALWPLGVWRRAEPTRRGYFWSMPVARGPHTLLRVAAGWLLLMGVCLAVTILALALAAPIAARSEEVRLSFAYAWVPFVMPTLPYLAVSVLAVASDSPFRFVAWAWAAIVGVALVSEITNQDVVFEVFQDVLDSLGVALGGPLVALRDSGVIGPWASNWALHYLAWFGGAAALLVFAAFRRRDAS